MSSKTPDHIYVDNPSTTVGDTDRILGYPVGGPMYAITAANFRIAMESTSLTLDGTQAMTAGLPAYVGTESLPGYAFSTDLDTGIYHVSANKGGLVAGGLQYLNWSSAGIETKNGVAFVGAFTGDNTPAATPTTTAIGYLGLPQNAKSGDYTLVIGDAGKEIPMTGSHTVTIPANASVAFPLGTVGSASIPSGSTLTLAITSDTLTWLPSGSTGSRTVTGPGIIFYRKYSATVWWCWGFNIT